MVENQVENQSDQIVTLLKLSNNDRNLDWKLDWNHNWNCEWNLAWDRKGNLKGILIGIWNLEIRETVSDFIEIL